MEAIKLEGLPLPPSANALHRAIGRGKVIKSAKFNEYEAACRIWMLTNFHQLAPARAFVAECGPLKFLRIDCVFYMEPRKILSKAKMPIANDTSNRIKAAHDVLAQMLHIDDKLFWAGSFTKVALMGNPHVTCTLSYENVTKF